MVYKISAYGEEKRKIDWIIKKNLNAYIQLFIHKRFNEILKNTTLDDD
jgi:hypothetical protein